MRIAAANHVEYMCWRRGWEVVKYDTEDPCRGCRRLVAPDNPEAP